MKPDLEDHTKEELYEALSDATIHLIGAASAYQIFAGNSRRAGKRDALYTTRMRDFRRAVARAQYVLTKGNTS